MHSYLDIENPPRQNPIRILLCVWWLSTTVIVNIYFGILFGQLVVPRVPRSIDTLEELANQDKIKWSVTRGSATYDLFLKSAPDSVYAKIGRSMENATSAEYGINRTLNSGWAFIREKSILTFKVSFVDYIGPPNKQISTVSQPDVVLVCFSIVTYMIGIDFRVSHPDETVQNETGQRRVLLGGIWLGF